MSRLQWRLVFTALILAVPMLLSGPVLASGKNAYIYYTPGAETGGKVTRAQVISEDMDGLRGFQVRITFDPRVVQVADADPAAPGTQVALGSLFKDSLVAQNTVDNTKGEIFVSAAKPGTEVTGTADLIWFDLRGVGPGNPRLTIADGGVVIVDKQLKEIKLAADTGELKVNAAGAPPQPAGSAVREKPLLRAAVESASDIPPVKTSQAESLNNSNSATKKTGSGQTAAEGGKNTAGTNGKPNSDRAGQVITIVGGVSLIGLIGYQIYSKKHARRKKRHVTGQI